MKITYTDFLALTDSIRDKLYEQSFSAVERDIILLALGLYGARIPGKLPQDTTEVVKLATDSNHRQLGPHRMGLNCPHQHAESGQHCIQERDHSGHHFTRVNGKALCWTA